jgi:hypothetical protein
MNHDAPGGEVEDDAWVEVEDEDEFGVSEVVARLHGVSEIVTRLRNNLLHAAQPGSWVLS